MSRIFVTGADGLVGGWLCRAVLDRGGQLTILRRPGATAGAALNGADAHCTVVEGDVLDAELLSAVVAEQRVDTVFHLAAQSIVAAARDDPATTLAVNVGGTWNVLEAARAGGARVVAASSDRAYGPAAPIPYHEDLPLGPVEPYDVSKACADVVARSYWPAFGLPVATTRMANVYGGGDRERSRLVPELIDAVLEDRPPALRSDGRPERDFLYVEDAVAVYLAIADALADGRGAGQAFNAGGGRPVSVRELIATLERVTGRSLDVRYEPVDPAAPVSRTCVDDRRLRALTGWRPRVDLEEGLRRTLAWHQARRTQRA